MSKRFDELFRDVVDILRRDYAGADVTGGRFDPRYYNTAIGQAWHDNKLDELLFLRYVSQMLAATGDRHLKLELCPSETYTPWSPGFFTRRFADSLYVTAVTGDTRLSPGDRIVRINGGTPARHREHIQKNFFYSDEMEREDWNGLLKMSHFIDVEHRDGTAEQLELQRHPRLAPAAEPRVHKLPDRDAVILDLRNVGAMDEDGLFDFLPLACRQDTPLSALIDSEIYVNYTRFNCMIKAAGLQGLRGGEEYIAELVEKSGAGMLPESDDDGEIIPGRAPKTVVVLTDTWTRDLAETLALAARRAGAVLLGRPTLGTIDFCGDVSYALDERYVLTWPTAVSKAAREGRGVLGCGVRPDVYIPWTPEECETDVLLNAATAYIENNK